MSEEGGSLNEVRGLNAIGNPETESRSEEGGMQSEGPIGQVRPTGVLARGTADKALWNSRGGTNKGSERLRSVRGRK
jgi:hypothetical protein